MKLTTMTNAKNKDIITDNKTHTPIQPWMI